MEKQSDTRFRSYLNKAATDLDSAIESCGDAKVSAELAQIELRLDEISNFVPDGIEVVSRIIPRMYGTDKRPRSVEVKISHPDNGSFTIRVQAGKNGEGFTVSGRSSLDTPFSVFVIPRSDPAGGF